MLICVFRPDGLISFVPKNILERKKQRWKFYL
jgi:branched-chain amino acid transport system permease protein